VENQDEVGALAVAFNDMAVQLQSILLDLELRVEERNRVIALSANVNRRLSTIWDTDQLVSEVVGLLQFACGYSYVQIYLIDEKMGNLLMVGGSGETGKLLLESGYQLGKGMGLVGRAAETGMAVLASDVRNDPGYLPNPLLPDTKAEITVPIIRGEQVIGVLDVQHNKVDGLGELDLYALQSITNQLATALENARQFVQAQRRAEQEAFLSDTVQQIQSTQSVSKALHVVVCKLSETFALRTHARLSVAHPSAQRDNSGFRE
jgi:GAF domain-containing protein